MGNYLPGVRRDFSVVARDSSRGVLAPSALAYQQSLSGVSVPTPLGAVLTREIYVYFPGL